MVEVCERLARSKAFQNGVLALIVFSALAMGLESWPTLATRWSAQFDALHAVVQVAFVVELVVRVAAHGRRPLSFFSNGWNTFDFAVVALSLLPVAGPFAAVARVARVLRVARLVTRRRGAVNAAFRPPRPARRSGSAARRSRVAFRRLRCSS